MTTRQKTILHLFGGSGGSGYGSKRAGFLGQSIDYDQRACDDYRRLTGEPAHCRSLATMTITELLELVPECPDVLMSSSPCVGLSGCLAKKLSETEKYQDFNSLALRGVELAVETWKHAKTGRKQPGLIVFENVPLIKSRGKVMLERIVALLHAEGYAVNMRSHDCGEVAEGLAEKRPRFLLVARHMATVPDFLRIPPRHRPLAIRQVLWELKRPRGTTPGMHRLPAISDLNALRLACIPAGGDWRDLPAEVLLYPCRSDELEAVTGHRWHKAQAGSELHPHDWDLPVKEVIGAPAQSDAWTTADPSVGWASSTYGDRPHGYGVADPAQPSSTIRGKQLLVNSKSAVSDPRVAVRWPENENRHDGKLGILENEEPAHTIIGNARPCTTRAAVADPRLPPSDTRQNGGFGVLEGAEPSGTVVGEGTTRNTRASVQDPRLSCTARAGAYGMADPAEPSCVIVGNHFHDNSPSSTTDPRLAHAPHNGSYGVQDAREASAVVRGEMSFRQAPSAVDDPRLGRGGKVRKAAPKSKRKPGRVPLDVHYDAAGWPAPTHELVILADGRHVLYGPALDFESKRSGTDVVIRAPDGTCHRQMTTRELARIQGFPNWFEFCGPSSCGKPLADGTPQTGQRKRIGNAVPPPTAYAICQEMMQTLVACDNGGFRLSGGDIWVQPDTGAIAA